MKSYLWLLQVNLSGICHIWKRVIASEGRLWARSLCCFILLHQCGSLLTNISVSEQPCITLASSTPKFNRALHFKVLPLYWRSLYHHQILLLLVEHRASMKSFQALWSLAIPLTSFHDLLVLLNSSSIAHPHILFGLPLLLYPWGFQSNAVFSSPPVSLHNVCPIQFHFLLFIWFSIDFCWVILHCRVGLLG